MFRRSLALSVTVFLVVASIGVRPTPASATTVIMGDSIMAALTMYTDLVPSDTVNLAVGGSQVALLSVFASYAALLQPSKIFIMDGVNDVNSTPISTVQSIYDYILGYFEMTVPTATVYVESILPVNLTNYSPSTKATNSAITEYNSAIQETVSQHGNAVYLNIASNFADSSGNLKTSYTDDGIHLNQTGLTAWNGIMSKYF